MAAFYTTNTSGGAVGYRSQADLDGTVGLPSGIQYIRYFDEGTNASLVASWQTNAQAFSMPGGTVTVNDVPATFNPDGAWFAAKSRAEALLSKLKNTNDPFTREDIADAIAIAFHADGLPST